MMRFPLSAPIARGGPIRLPNILRRVFGQSETPVFSNDKTVAPTSGVPHRAHIALVGAGPGAKDLLTLRAVERIQQADVVFYDRLVGQDVIALARKDAECVFVGKHVGAHAWPQDRINAVIVSEALKGRRVVRLKSGDPGIFGRAGEELAAARAEGIPVEIVPGVTSASAAAASLGQSLTERGIADTLILTTGMSREGDPLPQSARFAGPGTTTALYMSVRQSARISAALLARGLPQDAPVHIVVDASKRTERRYTATAATFADTLASKRIIGCAMILVTWPSANSGNVTSAAEPAAALA
ncbi:uroporphyrinogen-III C-methyltransferase [Marivita hallyeonensis]|uniref:uroporphyrinogen-III C-methyltransferase n=1 Tax=Marivita hallyeonensis TaxID=996342 RepID=A0A1M5SG56_9RHOB|nr:uroporphyrinogen-III C-methyltransferase [Marivita hallyeonensis]SHH37445.1 uroporphyrin-III C-methyltransferase / precorrin-2 dehydrogenase / sirohydrochlorin ferrochelatase [Marivita hallyeonensis]